MRAWLNRGVRLLAVLSAAALAAEACTSSTVVATPAPTIVMGIGSACARDLRRIDLAVYIAGEQVEQAHFTIDGVADLPVAAQLEAHAASPDTMRTVTATFVSASGAQGTTATSYREGTDGRIPLMLVCACFGVPCAKGYQCEQDQANPDGAVCAPIPVSCGTSCGTGGAGGTTTTTTTTPPANDGCAGLNDGLYCGGNGVSGKPDTLYACTQGARSVAEVCTNGCQLTPGPDDDSCKSAAQSGCAGVDDGTYCGNNGLGEDPKTLYQCAAGAESVVTVCTHGCTIMPSGTADHCAKAGGPCAGKTYGFYCGDDGLASDPDTLYLCADGVQTVHQVCTNGCQTNTAGYDDVCITSTTSPCSGKVDGLYCGNDGLGQNAGTLYRCSAGAMSQVQVCADGCQINAAGTDDACITSTSPCSGKANGLYCGNDGLGQNASTLYKCTSGAMTQVQVCANGCQINAAGTDDACITSTSPCSGKANGLYCGNDGLGQNAGTLYRCSAGAMTQVQVCANGCQINAAGTDDACITSTSPCSGKANGLYCGNDGLGQNASTLYKCTNGAMSQVQVCANGCQINAAGTDDACITSSSPCSGLANGLYCGNDGLGQNASTLYKCTNGAMSQVQVCTYGCQINAAGTDDACKSGGSSANCSGQVNGLYCGNDGLGGDAKTLYRCSNGSASVYQVCPNGCTIMPAGTNDACY